LIHAISDLRDNPVDARGFRRSAVFAAAQLDHHMFPQDAFRAVMEAVAAQVGPTLAWITRDCGDWLEVKVALGGEGTVGGLSGAINVWLNVKDVGRALVARAQVRKASRLSEAEVEAVLAAAPPTHTAYA
jgi:hypothetical protein